MKDKLKLLSLFHLILMEVAIVFNVIVVAQMAKEMAGGADISLILRLLSGVFRILALVTGVAYFIRNYAKNAAKFYKAFLAFTVISFLLRIAIIVTGDINNLHLICSIMSLGLMLLLTFGKDLGPTKTIYIYVLMIFCEMLIMFTGMDKFSLSLFVAKASTLLLAGSIGLLILFKYVDKADRGTK